MPKRLTLPDPTIFVINRSRLITVDQARLMTTACATQAAEQLCPTWGLVPVGVRYASPDQVLPVGARVITLADTMDEPDALGYHTIDRRGIVSGVIGVKTCLDHGAKPLTGAYSVSSVLSHEVCELIVDPYCASWCDTGRGYLLCAEACDPVQSDSYPLAGVSVSSFVTPNWFNAEAPAGTLLDWLGKVRKPFAMTAGGYYVRWAAGKVDQVFGAELPEWIRERKRSPYSRAGQRLLGRPGQSLSITPAGAIAGLQREPGR